MRKVVTVSIDIKRKYYEEINVCQQIQNWDEVGKLIP